MGYINKNVVDVNVTFFKINRTSGALNASFLLHKDADDSLTVRIPIFNPFQFHIIVFENTCFRRFFPLKNNLTLI